jgi:hypothetical protein
MKRPSLSPKRDMREYRLNQEIGANNSSIHVHNERRGLVSPSSPLRLDRQSANTQ